MKINVDIDIHINDMAYSIANDDYFILESVLKDMQELINKNQFKSESYKNLKNTFITFLKSGVEKNEIDNKKVNSEIYYYTR